MNTRHQRDRRGAAGRLPSPGQCGWSLRTFQRKYGRSCPAFDSGRSFNWKVTLRHPPKQRSSHWRGPSLVQREASSSTNSRERSKPLAGCSAWRSGLTGQAVHFCNCHGSFTMWLPLRQLSRRRYLTHFSGRFQSASLGAMGFTNRHSSGLKRRASIIFDSS